MLRRARGFLVFLFSLSFLLFASQDASSAPLPKSTQEILKKLKLDPSILSDIDKELDVPQDWIEKAKKEGKLRILTNAQPSEAKVWLGPFKERYPFISIRNTYASRRDKIKVLVSYKAGRIITDFMYGVGGSFFQWKEAGGLEDLRSIPTVQKLRKEAKDPGGLWVGATTHYWCMSYNTRLVKKEDLPKKWEDLLKNPIWRGRNLALGNRPNLWALHLWKAKGENWIKGFLTRIFTELKPQLRKEGMSALGELVAAGEFHAAIPASEDRTKQLELRGAPIGYNCPEPVPVSVSENIILKGAPNVNAAKIFVNWYLSKEGQIAQWLARTVPPVRADLMLPKFNPYPDQILGKKMSFREPRLLTEVLPRLLKFWNDLWLKGGGKTR